MSSIHDALLEARKEMKMPPLNGVGHAGKGGARTYKYALLQDVLKCVMPPLMEHGVLLTQGIFDGELKTIARKGDEEVVLDSRSVLMQGNPQELGSAETYAKRYALCTVFCISGMEDDDGEAASDQRVGKLPQKPDNKELMDARNRLNAAIDAWAERNGMDAKGAKAGILKRQGYKDHKDDPKWFVTIAMEFEEDTVDNG